MIGKYEIYSDLVEQTTTVNQLVNALEKIANSIVSVEKLQRRPLYLKRWA